VGLGGDVAAPESTNADGASVPAPALNPTPCTAAAASVRSQSQPLITYCEPVWLTIVAFQMLVIVRL